MYIVHMKKVTASQARREWFRILDEAARGETFVIDRKGRRLVLQRQPEEAVSVPDYGALLTVPEADRADAWSWSWSPEGLEPRNSAPADGGGSPKAPEEGAEAQVE